MTGEEGRDVLPCAGQTVSYRTQEATGESITLHHRKLDFTYLEETIPDCHSVVFQDFLDGASPYLKTCLRPQTIKIYKCSHSSSSSNSCLQGNSPFIHGE